MSEIFEYLVKVDHTQEFKTESFRDAHSIYQSALKQGRLVQVYHLVLDNDGIIHAKKE